MKTQNWIHGWLKSIWSKPTEKDSKKPIREDYPYNIEFGDGRTKEEMDKMQEELMKCGCLPDCGCKEA